MLNWRRLTCVSFSRKVVPSSQQPRERLHAVGEDAVCSGRTPFKRRFGRLVGRLGTRQLKNGEIRSFSRVLPVALDVILSRVAHILQSAAALGRPKGVVDQPAALRATAKGTATQVKAPGRPSASARQGADETRRDDDGRRLPQAPGGESKRKGRNGAQGGAKRTAPSARAADGQAPHAQGPLTRLGRRSTNWRGPPGRDPRRADATSARPATGPRRQSFERGRRAISVAGGQLETSSGWK